MPHSLDKISIRGYKSIRELNNFPLNSLNVLIGSNGAGKTNFISFFKLINQIVNNNLQVFVSQSGGADSLLYFGQKTSNEMSFNLSFGLNGYKCSLVPSTNDNLIFSEEKMLYHYPTYPNPYVTNLGGGQKETELHNFSHSHKRMTVADYILGDMKSWRIYHFHDTSAGAKVKQQGNINDNQVFQPDASNLAAFLYLLRETNIEYYSRIVSTIRLVAPFFDDFVLRPNPFNESKIILEWKEKGTDIYFDAHTLSDGTLRFICLATLLLQPKLPSTILIDEPELGLHPSAIIVLSSLLKSTSKKSQIIISTQSVPLVNQFDPEDIVVVERNDGQSTFERQSITDLGVWLENFGMGDIWEKNLLGGRPK